MLVFRSNPLSPLYTHLLLLIFFFCFFLSFSHGAYHLQHTHNISDGREIRNGVEMMRRIVSEISLNKSAATPSNPSSKLILAPTRTHRRDPSNGFKYYTGGWNISDPHYLYSVGFSAAPPIIVGGIWFFFFGLWLVFMIIRHCCCRCCCLRGREPPIDHNRIAYAITLCLLLLFTIATIGGGVVSYVGEEKLEDSIIKVACFVLHRADFVFGNLRTLFNNLLAAKKIGVEQLTLPPEIQSEIDDIGVKINYYADKFHNVTQNSSQNIRKFLEPIRLTLIGVAAALLLLIWLGFIISLFGIKFLIYCLVIIGWIVVAVTFFMSGMFLLLHNAVEDTCVAVDEWLQNPNADSALENIVPRVDRDTAHKIYDTTRGVTYEIVQVVDGAIKNVTNVNFPPNAAPAYYNQSGPLMPLLCNPYNADRTDRQCAPGEVDFKNASQVWSKYVCQVSGSPAICKTEGRLTPQGYTDITTTANVSSVLYEEGPFLMSLVDSTFIMQLFASIEREHCPGLSEYSKMTYAGFTTASAGLLLSIVFWIVHGGYAKQRREVRKNLSARN